LLSGATFVGTDTTTRGAWSSAYGADGYDIPAVAASLPSYATVSTSAFAYPWAVGTTDPRALTDPRPGATGGVASYWDSTSGGTSIALDVHLTDGAPHEVALYALDWEGLNRAERVDVVDDDTGTVLDSRTVTGFGFGTYLVWDLQGDVTLRVTSTTGAATEVADGLFFGGTVPGAPPAPPVVPGTAAFVGTDTTTQGAWQSAYGADGYDLPAVDVSLPPYATVSPVAFAYPWAVGTSDPRALTDPRPGATGGVASYWTNVAGSSTFPIDIHLNLGAGDTHRVALYLLDWDNLSRTERVDVVDDSSGAVLDSRTVSGFQDGAYLVWDLAGDVTLQVTCVSGGPNAVVSGLFFNPNPVPPAPTGLTATAGGPSRVNLSWSDVPNETGFSVERSTDGSTFTRVGQVGAHVTAYADTGLAGGTTYDYRVRATSAAGDSPDSATAGATTPETSAVTVEPIDAVEGVAFTAGVAGFSAPDDTVRASDYTALVDWGDGSTSVGTVVADRGATGVFTVDASHTYAEEGSYPVRVTVEDRSGDTSSASGTATVSDQYLGVSPVAVAATAGRPFEGTVATFTEGFDDPAGDFRATIDWGDGTSSPGTVVAPATRFDPFRVVGAHTYAATGVGTYTTEVVVTRADGSWNQGTGTAAVAGLPAGTVTAVEGQGYGGTVATFDGPPGSRAGDYTATVDLTDGAIITGTVSATGPGAFAVAANLAGAAGPGGSLPAGVWPYTVTVRGPSGFSLALSGQLRVVAGPIAAAGLPVTATAGQPYQGPIAALVLADPGAALSYLVDWGDGSPPSVGEGWASYDDASHTYEYGANHTYQTAGSYTIAATVARHDGSGAVSFTAPVTVLTPGTGGGAPPVGLPWYFWMPQTIDMSVTHPELNLGTFHDSTLVYQPTPPEYAALSLGPYNWFSQESFVDVGSTDVYRYLFWCEQGLYTLRKVYAVSGYGSPYLTTPLYRYLAGFPGNTMKPFVMSAGGIFVGGDGRTQVTLEGDESGALVTAPGIGSGATSGLVTQDPVDFAAVAGVPTGNVVVGTLDDAVAQYVDGVPDAVTVDWGDGTSGPGVLVPADGTHYQILGDHLYLAQGTYSVRVWVSLPSPYGTSSERYFTRAGNDTATVSAGGLSGTTRDNDPALGEELVVGREQVALDTGGLRTAIPLDFDRSPGTAVGGDPALVYNSDTVDARPIVEAVLTTDPAGPTPTSIQARLTFGVGGPTPWVTFDTTGHNPGDPYLLAVRAAAPLPRTGLYPWVLHVRQVFAGGTPIDSEVSGTARVVVRDATAPDSADPYGPGWWIDGLARIVPLPSLDALLVDGSGDSRLFRYTQNLGTYTNPPGEFGTLSGNGALGSGYVYTAKDQSRWYFNQQGLLTGVVDRFGVTRSYQYDAAGRLARVVAPDGGVTTLTYSGATLAISEPGGRAVSATYDAAGDLVLLTEPDRSTRTFGYDADHRLVSDRQGPLLAAVTYDPGTGTVSAVDRGAGDVTAVTAADTRGLQTSPAQGLGPQGLAVVRDALARVTTYTLDAEGRPLRVDRPADVSEAWRRDDQGLATEYVDPLGRVTAYVYDESPQGAGDLTEVDHPDGDVERFRYDPVDHTPVARTDSPGGLTLYDPLGDLATDPDGNVWDHTYDGTGLLLFRSEGTLTTAYAYDAARRLSAVTDPDGRTTVYTYDDAGNLRTVTDPDGRVTTTVYDALNRLVEEDDPAPRPGAPPEVTTMAYDGAGDLVSETDPNGVVTDWTYDQRGLVTDETVAAGTSDAETTRTVYDPAGEVVATIDPRGKETDYGYDADGRRVWVRDPDGLTTTTAYDPAGEVTATVDPRGVETDYAYDAGGRLTSQTVAAGTADAETTSWVYDLLGDVTSETDPRGVETDFAYDADNNLVSETDGAGAPGAETSRDVYDVEGRLVAAFDPLGNETDYGYDAEGRRESVTEAAGTPLARTTRTYHDAAGNVVKTVDARGTETDYSYDGDDRLVGVTEGANTPTPRTTSTRYDADGNVVAAVDARGVETDYTYDDEGRQTSVTEAANTTTPRTTSTVYDADGNVVATFDALGTETTYAYDDDDRLVGVTEGANTSDPRTTSTVYDADGDVVATVDALGVETDYTYDDLGRQTSVTEAANTTSARASHTRYDADGNVVATVDPAGVETDYTYDPEGRQASVTQAANTSLAQTSETVYDADGEVVATVDPLGHRTSYTYDPLGRRTEVEDPLHGVTRTAYDADDDVTSVTDPAGNTTAYAYDAFGDVTSMTDPLGHTATYTYDPAGDLVSTTDRDGRRTDTVYDAFGRPTTETWYDAQGDQTDTIARTYDLNDNLLSATNHDGATAVAFTYDAFNRVATRQGPFGDALTYTYDANDNPTAVTATYGSFVGAVASAYDPLNRLATREWSGTGVGGSRGPGVTPVPGGPLDARVDYTYTPTDQLDTLVRSEDPTAGLPSITSKYHYDAAERLTGIDHAAPGLSRSYGVTYDAAGRVTGTTDDGATTDFTYDDTDQLLTDGPTSYSYDTNGNRTNPGYRTGTGNQVLSDGTWTYTYDGEGNRVKKTNAQTGETWTYGYDNDDHMVWAEDRSSDGGTLLQRVTYEYDALGDRVEEDFSPAFDGHTSIQFAYDGANVWADIEGGQVTNRYLLGDAVDEVLGRIVGDGAPTWFLTDYLGSVRDEVSAAGTVVNDVDYDAYGSVKGETTASGWDPTRYGYAGRESDAATGLEYDRARYYDAAVGGWTGQDPAGFAAGDANLYRYVGNGPTDATDPSGLDSVGVEGSNVVWRVPANDNRSPLRKFWDGLTGQNQSPKRSYIVGRISSQGDGANSMILSDGFGGRRVSLTDLQQAARVVNLGGIAPEQQAGAVASQIQKAIFGLYGSESQAQDRIVGAASSVLQFAVDTGNTATPIPIYPGDLADTLLGGFVGNPNGSPYHQGKVDGEAAIMTAMAVDAAFPGGIIPRRGAAGADTVRATGGESGTFRPGYETRISPLKPDAAVEAQMDRIVKRVSERMGVSGEYDVSYDTFGNEEFEVFGGQGDVGVVVVDSGVLNPSGSINAPVFSRLPLRSRIEVIIAHEVEEVSVRRYVSDTKLSHALTVREGAPTTPLKIGQRSRAFLESWGRTGPYNKGIP
jgi:RHS repeat-associated protein